MQYSAYNEYSDSELIVLMQTDDHIAFDCLYHRYIGCVYAYLYSVFPEVSEFEDVVQETFISLWEKRKALQNRVSVLPFLMVSARNRTLNTLRNDKSIIYMEECSYVQLHRAITGQTYNDVEYLELYEIITSLINRLPTTQRRVVMMSKFDGLSHMAISAQLNINVQSVKNALSLALRDLRRGVACRKLYDQMGGVIV